MNQTPEPKAASFFCIRVRMPDPSQHSQEGGHESPYQRARQNAIFAVKPQGFEVKWPLLGQDWPIDSDGFTWVPLYHSDDKEMVSRLLEKIQNLEQRMFEASEYVQQAGMRLGVPLRR